MHFALPPRKTSRPPPYAASRPTRSNWTPRRVRPRSVFYLIGGGILFFFAYLLLSSGSEREYIPAGTPPVVLVTILDHGFGPLYDNMIRQNRELYARKQGYATFFANITDYDMANEAEDVPPAPRSWAKLPAMRHAMTTYPHSTYFFWLDQHALIMRPELSLEAHIMKPSRLQSIMIPDKPVVPPDSIIHTFKNTKAENVDFVVTQDHAGLSQYSFIVKRTEWAKFLLDSWFDPLYRSYNFQKAEGHALEHLVQWHGTILQRMAIVPQKIMNSYTRSDSTEERYSEDDFVAHFYGCDWEGAGRNCKDEVLPMYEHLASVHKDDG